MRLALPSLCDVHHVLHRPRMWGQRLLRRPVWSHVPAGDGLFGGCVHPGDVHSGLLDSQLRG